MSQLTFLACLVHPFRACQQPYRAAKELFSILKRLFHYKNVILTLEIYTQNRLGTVRFWLYIGEML